MSYSNTIISQPTVRDEENVFYVDRFNKVLDVMVDDRGIVYVPLHTVADVANIRRVKRKSFSATACDYETNPDNYIELDKPPNEERNQQHSFRDRRTVRHASRDEEPAGRQRHNSSMINGHEPPPGLQVTVKNMRRRNGESTEDESLENKREAGKSSGSRVPTRTPVSPRPAAVKSAPARRIKNEPAEDDWSENSRPQRDQKRPTKPIGASTATTTTNRSQETRPSSAGFKQLSYSLVELSGTQFTTITVTDVLNETDVWVQLEELADSLAELTYRVIQEAVDAEPISAAVGQLCLAQFEGVWYRAVLLGTRPCRVRYIDFGNEQSEPEGGTLTISNALAALPAHALHVRLPRARSLEEGDKLRVKQRSIMDGVHLVQPEDEPDVTAAVAAPPAYDKFVLKRLQQNQSGLLLAAMKFSDDKFVGGLLPGEFEEELQALNALCEQCPRLSGYSPAPGDLVAARLEPEGWCRALLQERLPAGKYRVAFVDYGKEETVRELRPVPEDKRNIPWFCCVCTVPAQHVDSLLKTECLRYSVVSCADTSIRLRLKEEGGEEDMCSAEVSGWWPTVPAASDLDVPQAEPALGLKSGDKVQLLTENNGLLYVRNKRSRELLDRVSELMRRWEPFAPFLAKRPPPGQLVAAEFGKDWYRAQVLQVSGDQATVLYVDYGNEERLPWSGLKELSEELLRIPHTAFKVRLEGFEDGSFSTKQTSRLEQLAHYRTLLTIVSILL